MTSDQVRSPGKFISTPVGRYARDADHVTFAHWRRMLELGRSRAKDQGGCERSYRVLYTVEHGLIVYVVSN